MARQEATEVKESTQRIHAAVKYAAYFHVSVEELQDVVKKCEEGGGGQNLQFVAKRKEGT